MAGLPEEEAGHIPRQPLLGAVYPRSKCVWDPHLTQETLATVVRHQTTPGSSHCGPCVLKSVSFVSSAAGPQVLYVIRFFKIRCVTLAESHRPSTACQGKQWVMGQLSEQLLPGNAKVGAVAGSLDS